MNQPSASDRLWHSIFDINVFRTLKFLIYSFSALKALTGLIGLHNILKYTNSRFKPFEILISRNFYSHPRTRIDRNFPRSCMRSFLYYFITHTQFTHHIFFCMAVAWSVEMTNFSRFFLCKQYMFCIKYQISKVPRPKIFIFKREWIYIGGLYTLSVLKSIYEN